MEIVHPGPVDHPAASDGDSRVSPTSRSGASAIGNSRCSSIPIACAATIVTLADVVDSRPRRDGRGGRRIPRLAAATAGDRPFPCRLHDRTISGRSSCGQARPAAPVSPAGPRRRLHECAAHRRRRRGSGGLSAPDRRRGDQSRRRLDADRGEAAGRQHAPGHPRRRSGHGRLEAGPAGRDHRHHHLPPRDVHRDVAARI